VVVDGVAPAEFSTYCADLQKETRGKRSKGDATFFDVYAFFAEGDEGIGACVGVDDGLQADFGLVEFKRARRRNGVAPGRADEVADQADVRIEELGVGGGAAISLRLRYLRLWCRDGRDCCGGRAVRHGGLRGRVGGQRQGG